MRGDQKAMAGAGVLTLLFHMTPGLNLLGLPFIYLSTHAHELFHAAAAVLTGGSAHYIKVFANGSGVTPVTGGFLPVIASAGYVGSALLGGALIYFGRTAQGARAALAWMCAILAVSLVFWVRGDLVGVLSALFWIALLAYVVRYWRSAAVILAAQFVGLQLCLYGLQAFFVLLRITAYTGLHNDAKLMERATLLPAVFWATAWALFSIVMMGLTLRRAWREPAPRGKNVLFE
ncbi:MAG: M50 family metallopeptidase [Armatimonadetes bacterium]|nr:M50 family metallopeptidase [Armatimonadota bacterium]